MSNTKGIINGWNTVRVNTMLRKRFKRKFKKKLLVSDISNIWKDYIKEDVLNNISKGIVSDIDNSSRIWVKATRTVDNKRFMSLLSNGLMYRRGRILEADINMNTSEYIYDIVFESKRWKSNVKLFFQPHKDLSKAVRDGILKGKLITREYVG